MNTGKTIKSAVAIAALTGMLVTSAVANTISLDTGNSGISGYTGPYGSVTVTLIDSTHAGITFTALDNGYHFLLGDGGSVALNVNGTIDSAAAVASIVTATGPQQGANPPGPWTYNPGNEDGWGSFNFALDNFDGFSSAVKSISFTLHNTSGTWGSDLDVLALNNNDNTVAAHIFIANSDYSNTGATGYATAAGGSSTDVQVPDGGLTVALLGFVVAGIGMARRKFGV